MIIGYLAFGILGAFLSTGFALLSGFGLWAAFGFYVLGGTLSMMAAIGVSLCWRPAHQHRMVRAEA